MTVSLRSLDAARADLRALLTGGLGGSLRVEDGPTGRWIEVDVVPDGIAHLLRVSASDGRKLFDCRGMGVAGLTDEGLAFLIVAAFRVLERRPS